MVTNSLERLAKLLVGQKFLREFEKVRFEKPLDGDKALKRILHDEVLAYLYPMPVTVSEFCDRVREFMLGWQLRGLVGDGFDKDRFLTELWELLDPWFEEIYESPRASDTFPVASIASKLGFLIDGEVLWDDGEEDGDAVIMYGTGPSSREPLAGAHEKGKGPSEVLYVQLRGRYSAQALEQFSSGIEPVIRSTFTSAAVYESGVVNKRGQLPELGAEISKKELRRHLDFVAQWLKVYFAFNPYAKKALPGLAGRIPIAMILLSEADRQAHPAAALALCFSTIEAAFGGSNKEGITKTLAENVAALLEPNRLQRADAVKAVKELYGIRSEFVHGVKVQDEPEARSKCRLLAAAVIQALTERLELDRRIGKTSSDFLAELKHDYATGQFVVGPDRHSPAQRLWRQRH